MITVFSNRIYKDTIQSIDVDTIERETHAFNQAKWKLVKLLVGQENGISFLPKNQSLHMYVKSEFSFNDYYANSVINVAKAAIDGHKEVHKLNIQTLKDRIATKETKVKELRKQVANKLKMLQSCIQISKATKVPKPRKKDLKLKTYQGCKEKQLTWGYAVCYKRYTRIYYNLYDFEHKYLRSEITRLKNRISMINHSVSLMRAKLQRMQAYLPGVTFGTKKLFKSQFTKYAGQRHGLWLTKWRCARIKSFKIVGRKDGKYGNFVFKYQPVESRLEILLRDRTISITGITFPYGQELLTEVLLDRTTKRPVTWEIENRGLYYIIKAMFEPPGVDRNYYTGDGVVAYDKNYDHIAWVELDDSGRMLRYGKIPVYLENKTRGQAAKILEAAAIVLVNLAKEARKPLAGELIDTASSKSKLAYGPKRRNFKITQFAYDKMDQSIESRANKYGVGVLRRNPAYTSVIGKMKYMRQLGVPVHTAAALVIGRRVLGKVERVPAAYRQLIPERNLKRHHWSHWRYLRRYLKQYRVDKFYSVALNKVRFENMKECKLALA